MGRKKNHITDIAILWKREFVSHDERDAIIDDLNEVAKKHGARIKYLPVESMMVVRVLGRSSSTYFKT